MKTTIQSMLTDLNKNQDVEDTFLVPIKEILSELKVIKKKKDKPEHLEMTVIVPLDLAKNIEEFYDTKWGLGLFGIKYKKKMVKE